jgi:hypothetical protein
MPKHSRTARRKLIWLAPIALLTVAGAGSARAAERTTGEPQPARPECKNAGVTVTFVRGSTELDTNGRGALAGVATWLQNGDQRSVRLEGYADKKGGATANQRLSERRAQAAKEFLLGRGIAPDRIMAFGHGEGEDLHLTGAESRVVVVTACDVPAAVAADTPPPPEPEPEPEAAPEPAPPPSPAPKPAPVAKAPPPPAPVIPPVTIVPPPVVEKPKGPASVVGIEATVGGGAIGFIDERARAVAGTGGSWDARLMFGSRLPIAVEGAYVGSAQSIDALGLSSNSVLVGNGFEGTLRVNLTRGRIQPYLFGGAGFAHYQLSNTSNNTSSVLGGDDVGTVPLGAGITGRLGGSFIVDARGTYRATFDDDMLRATAANNNSMQSWNASARIGFEF